LIAIYPGLADHQKVQSTLKLILPQGSDRLKEITLADKIKPGTILITEGARLPESLLLESEPYGYGWRLVKNLDSRGLDQIMSKAGWNFFYIASVVETNALGSDEKKTARKAIKKIITNLKSKNFNCLEITRVTAKRSLGLLYLSVSAHSRHIQEGQALSGE
jgi:hypothetical protein